MEEKDKSQYFLSNLSLQIRNPISGIVGHTQLLSQTKLDNNQKMYVNTINQCCVQIIELVNDILDFSKIISNKAQINNDCVSLSEIVDELNLTIGNRIEEKKQYFATVFSKEIPEYIVTDKQKLLQILINLISNAIKYTPVGGKIILSATPYSADEIEFSVEDNGIGISQEEQANIFTPFNPNSYGLGLGLSIVKKLVDILNGTIRVESEKNEGAKFIFTIKYETYEDFEKLIHCYSEVLKNKYFLIADDNVDNRVIVGDMLFEASAKPIFCSSIKEIFKIVGKYPFCCLLLSSNIYRDTGLIKQLRELQSELMVICLKGEEQNDYTQFDRIIHKPITKFRLIDTLYKVLSKNGISSLQLNSSRPTSPRPKDAIRILIVDSVVYHSNMIAKMIGSMGYTNVDITYTAEEAIEKIKDKQSKNIPFDIVLTSLKISGNGINIVEYIKKGQYTVPKIAVISASVFEEDREKCRLLGVDYFLSKPIVVNQLKLVLQKLTDSVNSIQI